MRPAEFCRGILASLDAAEGRRKRRRRDTTPDSIGLDLERDLLARVQDDDPAPAEFEAWLAARVLEAEPVSGPIRATALRIHEQWRLAQANAEFRDWLARGAPSDDAEAPESGRAPSQLPSR